MSKQLLSGNEAIAQGAWECGVAVGVGYPGTPSTETLENLAKHEDVYCEWSPNEKVALEVGIGASMGGVRALVTMKHVGVNVAADPLMSVCNAGVNGGLVILAADDPSIYSSQNEQDSRNYAAFARVPMLEPSNSSEAHSMVQRAFDISEQFDTPVFIRETVRIAHTKTPVEASDARRVLDPKPYANDASKWVMVPANAKVRRLVVDERTKQLEAFAEECDLNRVEMRDTKMGIICSGACYENVRQALPDASTLKLGISWPLPENKIKEFAANVDELYVVEEACDFFDMRVRAMGVALATPAAHVLPPDGELTPARIRDAFGISQPQHLPAAEGLPPRPPALCAGCPHRLVFSELRRLKATVTGDIGCYTLGSAAPLSAVHSTIDMGASFSMAHGMELAGVPQRNKRPVVGVIGDSTFAHSGITSLLGTVYNGGAGTLCILDNRTTAMTGCQGNPCNGVTLMESAQKKLNPLDVPKGKDLDLEALVGALGVEDVRVVDAQNLKEVRRNLKEATSATDTLTVIIFKSPCRLIDRAKHKAPVIKDCKACGVCVNLGCPALGKDDQGHAVIDVNNCIGCDQCVQNCAFGCIVSRKGE